MIPHYIQLKLNVERIEHPFWPVIEEDLSSGKLESTHPSRTVVKLIEFFIESSRLYAAMLTHYSTEPLTTGPDYDPLLLLLAIAGDVHPNPGPPRYPCSVCFKNVISQSTSYPCTRCSHWEHSRCSGLRNAADYRKANGWICTARMTPPQPRAPSPPPSPAHRVRQDVQHTTVECQWYRQQTDGTKHLPRGAQHQSGGHSGVQAHGKIEKSKHPELHPSTKGSTPRPMMRLTVFLFITQSASLASHCQQRRRMTPT